MKYAVILGMIAAAVSAQPPAPKETADEDQKSQFTLDVTRVQLLFTVSDKKGRFVNNLTKDDFEVFEARKPQSVVEFTAESDLPLRIAILMDTGNTVRERFQFQQEAAGSFLETVLRAGRDKALLMSFDSSAEVVSDLTDDKRKLSTAIRGLHPGGGAALYDAIFIACRDKLIKEQPAEKFRRAMVILSDGEDNQSHWTREQALEMAQKADVVIYTISTNNTRLEAEGDKVLRYFAQETGGQTFLPFQSSDLEQSFQDIANELRHQYVALY